MSQRVEIVLSAVSPHDRAALENSIHSLGGIATHSIVSEYNQVVVWKEDSRHMRYAGIGAQFRCFYFFYFFFFFHPFTTYKHIYVYSLSLSLSRIVLSYLSASALSQSYILLFFYLFFGTFLAHFLTIPLAPFPVTPTSYPIQPILDDHFHTSRSWEI